MESVVVDTSVVMKWFVKEEDSDLARGILLKHFSGEVKLLAPEIVVIELVNGLFWGANVTEEKIQEAVDMIYSSEIEFVDVDEQMINHAVRYMYEFRIAVYDSLFLALAEREGVSLITADKKHHKRKYYDGVRYLG